MNYMEEINEIIEIYDTLSKNEIIRRLEYIKKCLLIDDMRRLEDNDYKRGTPIYIPVPAPAPLNPKFDPPYEIT